MTFRARALLAGLPLAAGAAQAWAVPLDGEMRPPPSLPALAREGPYGSALLISPPLHPLGAWAEPGAPMRGAPAIAAPDAERNPRRPAPGVVRDPAKPAGAGQAARNDDDEDVPRRPGTFGNDFVRVPSPIPTIRSRSLGPHLTPDAEFEVNANTSMGVLGRADRVDVRPGAGLVPSVRARDLGAGLVLQYRLGP